MSSTIVARTGRHRQRYEDQLRLVAGCIPFRLERKAEDHGDLENRLSVLMVSSPNRDDLVFPKGGWENDEEMRDAASREALEEAGVKGILGENPLGVWEFRSKSRQNSCSLEGGCRGYMFALEVTEELDSWPEMAGRHRKWLGPEEAFKLCRYDWMKDALRKLVIALSEDGTNMTGKDVENPLFSSPDAGADRQMIPAGFCGKSSGVQLQHLGDSCKKYVVQS